MQQDCMYSMQASTYGCRYTDGDQLCYSMPGQLFCQQNVPNSACHDLGEAAGDTTNLIGEGAWAPRTSVPVFGSAALTAEGPYTCYCLKNCVHASTSASSKLKNYRCTGGVANIVGTKGDSPDLPSGSSSGSLPAGAPTDRFASIYSNTKDGQCACACGYVGTAIWEQGDAQ